MSSGQSAIGTRTCSGNPEADWRLANGEDTMTSGGVRCQTSSYASGHMPAVGTSLPLPVCRLDTQNLKNGLQTCPILQLGIYMGICTIWLQPELCLCNLCKYYNKRFFTFVHRCMKYPFLTELGIHALARLVWDDKILFCPFLLVIHLLHIILGISL